MEMKGYAINHEAGRRTGSCPSKRRPFSSTESSIPTSVSRAMVYPHYRAVRAKVIPQ